MNAQTLNKHLFQFIAQSPTPFHAVNVMKNTLKDAGFKALNEKEDWQIKNGQPYYVIREDGALVAFNLGRNNKGGFRMVGSHADSPCLQLKPKADIYEKNYHQLGVEVYGGALLNPWFDRELSIAGRVIYQGEKDTVHSRLIDFKRPVAVIPSVAIHLDRNANTEKNINSQKDIVPLVGLSGDSKESFTDILKNQIIADDSSVTVNDILSFDLYCYDFHKPCYTGFSQDFILSSRLDNLLSCFLLTSAVAQANMDISYMFICNNHEEVGSSTASGARGNLLSATFDRIFPDPSDRHRTLANSFLLSVDNAHAIHPNFPEKHEPSHDIALNRGPVLKINATHKYASTGVANGLFKMLCAEKEIPVQEFVMRNDMACGSTIGPLTAAKLGVQTVDIGAASLAMHSIREMTGSRDPWLLFTVLQHFLQRENLPGVFHSD